MGEDGPAPDDNEHDEEQRIPSGALDVLTQPTQPLQHITWGEGTPMATTQRDNIMKDLLKLHRNMGHQSNNILTRCLEHFGAARDVSLLCAHFRCGVCVPEFVARIFDQ